MFSGCPSVCACICAYTCVRGRLQADAFTDRIVVNFWFVYSF